MFAELLALYGLGLGGAAVGHSVSSFWSSLCGPRLRTIFLDNSLLIGKGKIVHVINSHYDVLNRNFRARVQINTEKPMVITAKTKEELERMVQDLFESR